MEANTQSKQGTENGNLETPQPELIEIRLLDKIETIQNKAVSR
ncbi:hypothetical protein ACIQVC_15280 [Streptomyces sp. NPDC101112]